MVLMEQMRATEEWRRCLKMLKKNDMRNRWDFLKRYLKYNKAEKMSRS